MWALARLAVILSLACGLLVELGRAQSISDVFDLSQGQNSLFCAAYHDDYVYFGTNTLPGSISKVDATTLVETVLRFDNSSYSRFHTAIVDSTAGELYLG